MKATILLPNYNNESYLIECLNSIKEQTYSNFEILIIDDGSTDNSIKIINNFKDSRIRLIIKEKNSGIIDTLNTGLESIINSEYIIRMDGDDIMHPKRIELLVNFMDENPEFGVCGSGIQFFGLSNGTAIYNKDPKINKSKLLFTHSVGHASCIFRNSIFKKHNIKYSEGYNYIEDYKLFYDLGNVTQMTNIPDLLYQYRREEYNQYKNQDIKKIGYLKIYEELLSTLQFNNAKETAHLHFEFWHQTPLTHKKKNYRRHYKTILTQNKITNLFPEKELQSIVKNAYRKLFFRLIDQQKLSFFEGLEFFLASRKNFYYFLSSKKNQIKKQ